MSAGTMMSLASDLVVMIVMHDLNLACRYADHIIAMKHSTIVAEGASAEVLDAEVVPDVFGMSCGVVPDPVCGTPMVVPRGRHRTARMTPELNAG